MMLEHGDIEMGHAKALLGPSMKELRSRQPEWWWPEVCPSDKLKLTFCNVQAEAQSSKASVRVDPDLKRPQDDLSEKIGSPVFITTVPKVRAR